MTIIRIDTITQADITNQHSRELLADITRAEKVIASAHAHQIRALAAFNALQEGELNNFAPEEIAAAQRWTRTWAATRIEEATLMLARLPATVAALEEGTIDHYKAGLILAGTTSLTDDQARQVEQTILARAGQQNPSTLKKAINRAVLRADPQAAEKRAEQRQAGRRVELAVTEDGVADVVGKDLPAETAVAIYRHLDACARAI